MATAAEETGLEVNPLEMGHLSFQHVNCVSIFKLVSCFGSIHKHQIPKSGLSVQSLKAYFQQILA